LANEILIVRDGDGNYYQVPRAVLEEARVPADRVAELEEALAGEVSGFAWTTSPTFSRLDVLGVLRPPGGQHVDSHIDIFHADVLHGDRA
jgi:hypothetical protein